MERNIGKNIVLIIGNGFDLDLGLKTAYKDFWNSDYCPKLYPAPIIGHLNSKWKDSSEEVKWYDLENELLQYYNINASQANWQDILPDEEMNYIRGFNSYHYACHQYDDKIDILDRLVKKGYVTIGKQCPPSVEIPYQEDYKLTIRDRDFTALSLITQGLCKFLKAASKQRIEKDSVAISVISSLLEAAEAGNNLCIYNFNYTDLPAPYCDYENLFYIHGRCNDDNIIIGTKDYKEFNEDYDFLQKSFNPKFRTPPVVADLLNADEVIFFGHSLGMNDSQYFRPFFVQQTRIDHPTRKYITIFTKDNKSKVEIKRSLQQMTDYNYSLLNSLNSFEIIEVDGLNNNFHRYKDFLKRFINDENEIKALLRKL